MSPGKSPTLSLLVSLMPTMLLAACPPPSDPASPESSSKQPPPSAQQPAASDDHTDARNRMVDHQLKARGIENERVLEAMRSVPRHAYVPTDLRHRAYDDSPLPIGHQQTISQPYIVALMTQLADPHPEDKALDVGTGSGYQAAAECGPSLPGVAHMWHMPRHIYSRLHRYQDACWQQEASARVDHAHMMRDRVMPDQIHNFAHNNEWLIRNLLKVGRVDDALSLAKNMLELPRHRKYNTPQRRGSSRYGRERLELTLTTYRLWPQLLELADTVYLEPTDEPERKSTRLELIGRARASTVDRAGAEAAIGELQEHLVKARKSLARFENESPSAQLDDDPENGDEPDGVAEEASAGSEPADDEQAGDEQDGKEDKEVDEQDDEVPFVPPTC